jgi:hypothetical protein
MTNDKAPENKYHGKYFYAGEYSHSKKVKCENCNKIYSRSYKLKSYDNDEFIVSDKNENVSLCRKCMITNEIETRVKKRCNMCNSFFKSVCQKCVKDKSLKERISMKVFALLNKLENPKDINEIKLAIANYKSSLSQDSKQ